MGIRPHAVGNLDADSGPPQFLGEIVSQMIGRSRGLRRLEIDRVYFRRVVTSQSKYKWRLSTYASLLAADHAYMKWGANLSRAIQWNVGLRTLSMCGESQCMAAAFAARSSARFPSRPRSGIKVPFGTPAAEADGSMGRLDAALTGSFAALANAMAMNNALRSVWLGLGECDHATGYFCVGEKAK